MCAMLAVRWKSFPACIYRANVSEMQLIDFSYEIVLFMNHKLTHHITFYHRIGTAQWDSSNVTVSDARIGRRRRRRSEQYRRQWFRQLGSSMLKQTNCVFWSNCRKKKLILFDFKKKDYFDKKNLVTKKKTKTKTIEYLIT